MKFVLFALLATGAADTCCDAKHNGYALAAENAQVCLAKGGIPITTPVLDDGGHTFNLLTQCAFPCDQRLTVER